MRLPFTRKKLYTTKFSYEEIAKELGKKNSIRYFGSLRIDKYNYDIVETEFNVQRYSTGIDVFSEYFPLIKGEIINQNPTRILLTLKPNYFAILFFSIFVFGFGYGGIFVDNWTLNGVKRMPTISERFFIVILGSGIPFVWCYLQHIRPIKGAEKWITQKLGLNEQK